MAKVLVLVLLALSVGALLSSPWVAGAVYFLTSLLQPQYLWPWAFESIPIYKITAGLSILGAGLVIASRRANLSLLTRKEPLFLLWIWIWMHISHMLTPYKGAVSAVSPDVVLNTMTSIVIMFFVLLCLCQNEKSIKWLSIIFAAVGVYYVYWANSIYLAEDWSKFRNNRLSGPLGSPYSDENAFSTLLVSCFPFIICLFFKFQSVALKIGVALAIPLTWHALILCGSRGGFLATVVVLLGVCYVIRSKRANTLLIALFSIFVIYQGAIFLERSSETFGPQAVQSEKPINPRLLSWEAALKLIPKYPLFGVGVEKFQAASQDHFPGKTPNVAHNTFLNFSANTGVITGILFLVICIKSIRRLKWSRQNFEPNHSWSFYALTASSLSILGFFGCSIFLDLILYEPFYFALVINIVSWVLVSRDNHDDDSTARSLLRSRQVG